MKICIFGGNGFIGSNLAKAYLKKNYDVYIYSQTKVKKNHEFRKNYKITYTEKSFSKIISKNFDLIFFLSGNSNQETSKKDIFFDLQSSFSTFIQLLESVKKKKTKSTIWYASSVVVYGENDKALKEDFELNPVSYYAFVKLICEKACKFYSSNFNLNIGILRLFSTFGPDLKRQVIYDTIKKIKTLKKFKIIGDGNEIRNFCYINDQVKSIMQLSKKVKRPKGEIYNIASGRKFAIKQILKKLIKISNKKVNYIFTNKRRSFDTKNFIANKSKLFKTIGKHSLTPIEVALRKTYQSY